MQVARFSASAYNAAAILGVAAFVSLSFAAKGSPLQDVLLVAGLAWGIFTAVLAWRRLDETAREAHKFAWFYGGFGLVAALIVTLTAALPPDLLGLGHAIESLSRAHAARVEATLHVHSSEPVTGFYYGVLFAAVAQFAGYFLVWCAWWLIRRRRG